MPYHVALDNARELKRGKAAIDQTQAVVNGEVRLKFYKGNVIVVGRQSEPLIATISPLL
jgi:argininosuccinate synthase